VTDPGTAIVFYVVFVASLTLHEAAHALVAKLGGDPTAYAAGQVSLSPIPHMRREPFGMVLLPILSLAVSGWPFGFASAPYDPDWARVHPRRAAWMSLAGPGANLALFLLAGLLIRAGALVGWLEAPESVNFSQLIASGASPLADTLGLTLSILFSMNLLLLLLNLIPVPPLDGSGALGLLLSEDATRSYQDWVARSGFAWIGILIAWWLIGWIFHPAFIIAVNLLYPGVYYG
jgi:Zn-dependent protease